jgi:hypothetical protein
MQVRLVGGPLDGRVEEVDADLEDSAASFWPPSADLTKQDDRVPGVDDVVEYLYRGDGTAEYVGGLLDPEGRSGSPGG